MKIKLFTHTDLDGVGCAILANRAFGSDNVDFVLCNYNEINQKVMEFLESPDGLYDKIFITDISVNEEVAQMIQNDHEQTSGFFELLDHHSTAEWLNKYDWAYVTSVDYHNKKTAGTSLFYDWLIQNDKLDYKDWNAAQFTELVRSYDTWDWDRDNNQHAKDLNDLLHILGQSRFIKRFSEDIDPEFLSHEVMMLDIERNNTEAYIKRKANEATRYPIGGYVALTVFAERHQSELGNTLAKDNPDVDLVIMINAGSSTVSYRTVKDNVNVAELAKTYGGGGHPKASGSSFSKDLRYVWFDQIFLNSKEE